MCALRLFGYSSIIGKYLLITDTHQDVGTFWLKSFHLENKPPLQEHVDVK